MPLFWNANIETARWIGPDLQFDAQTEAGRVVYVITGGRLRGTAQRTSFEVLSANLPRLKPIIVPLARGAKAGDTIRVN